ncbi:diguanylate cyclase and HAMP domain-containing protein [Janthinobacterium sp. HH01]|uniref:diguanylate cyclase n=1 Tax=Janthinobacterium sp. HH01 TaxID=1198452 RepID=UPI0002AEB831|nr:diguanylate cyclase [Janthinobacterium sp. HH01]ELX11216.1 diguanylate cyclase and HAMP domain-containing protein [Janthinobacterium sp. HH01]
MSLRTKFMLALLLTGLAAVAMVGGLAYVGMTKKVDVIRRQSAADHFYEAMNGYLQKYGSWQAAAAAEPFDNFMHSQDGQGNRPPPPPDEEGDERRGPPPGEGPPRHEGGRPPPPRGNGEPPFHFIVADGQFRVLLGAGVYRPGEVLPESARKDARAIKVGERVEAYISPEGVFTPSKQEQQYIDAMREALVAGVTGAAALALVLGVLLSRGLSRKLSHLTGAVRAMHGGSLLQRVPVEGKDEVAALASAFNDMSEQLARSHEELKESHQTILAQAEQMRELSVRDALTKLHNRRHFDEQATTLFSHAVRHKRPLSVVIGDIDFFKRINDQFSHATGDAVLRQVGEILRSHMRLSDLVARYGGEEFVIAFPETELPQAAALCDKLRNMIEGFPWHEVHPDLKVTMSMGVYADLAAGTAEAMLQKADALLYRAKQTGRNRVCFA